MPNAFPLGGMAVAHDLLEHGLTDAGDVTGEIQAFGAMMAVRGDAYWHMYHATSARPELAYHIGSDFYDQYQYWAVDGGYNPNPPATRALEEHLEDQIRAVWDNGVRTIKEEADEGSTPEHPFTFDSVRGWMRIGYRRAVKRLGSSDTYHNSAFFRAIEQAADAAAKSCGEGLPARLRVVLNLKRHQGTLYVQMPYGDYDEWRDELRFRL
jgi:hypothetical protein